MELVYSGLAPGLIEQKAKPQSRNESYCSEEHEALNRDLQFDETTSL